GEEGERAIGHRGVGPGGDVDQGPRAGILGGVHVAAGVLEVRVGQTVPARHRQEVIGEDVAVGIVGGEVDEGRDILVHVGGLVAGGGHVVPPLVGHDGAAQGCTVYSGREGAGAVVDRRGEGGGVRAVVVIGDWRDDGAGG